MQGGVGGRVGKGLVLLRPLFCPGAAITCPEASLGLCHPECPSPPGASSRTRACRATAARPAHSLSALC